MTPLGWTRTLWLWWGVLAVLGGTLLGLGLHERSRLALEAREAEVRPRLQQLRAAFGPLRERQASLLLPLLADFRAGTLGLEALRAVRLQGEPFFTVYAWPALPGDRLGAPPPWLQQLVAPLPPSDQLTLLRPRAGAAESYLVWAGHNRHGQRLAASTNLGYVAGPWLRQQLAAAGLGGTRARVLDHAGPTAPASPGHERIATFYPEDRDPVQLVELELAPPATGGGPAVAAFALVMLSFAASLFLAGRAVRRELALAEARSNFTAMVSHELKTPVAAIRLYGEILSHRLVEDPAKVADYHRTIMAEAERLQRLLENLLDLGKIERGARVYQLAEHDVEALVDEAVAGLPAEALARERWPGLPPVLADRDAAVQAIANVLSNAFKYGGGQVTLATRLVGDRVHVEVLDRGPGIPPDRRQAIFEPYVRLEHEARRETQGTGLGLALVKAYMAGQGGGVTLEDRPGGGSLFRLAFMTKV